MADSIVNRQSNPTDKTSYKSTWTQRAWFASGCTTILISLAKSMLMLAAATPTSPRTFLQLTLAAFLGYLLADLASGIYHWAVDNYGSPMTPVFGSQIESFRAHHQHPSAITKSDTAVLSYMVAGVVTVIVLPINILSRDPVFLWFVGVSAGCGLFSLKLHAWAHTPKRKLPSVVAALQDSGIILRWSQHKAHHRPPFKSDFCTVSGIWNKILDESNIFSAIEVMLFRVFGVRPRSWSEPNSDWKLAESDFVGSNPDLD
ncbi:Ubiquitin-conjugating enzyme [Handroanthus impetiginosus]|uniref:Ubiquitin-conjugating enzyme n=1 Tax=Handroanthus impetiginosus TaxID=429701 RepID=A0A2G9G0D8_9LAMI|nr:Ubiquitin-conjugating enzyme [Handroanthus impetiginosus]